MSDPAYYAENLYWAPPAKAYLPPVGHAGSQAFPSDVTFYHLHEDLTPKVYGEITYHWSQTSVIPILKLGCSLKGCEWRPSLAQWFIICGALTACHIPIDADA